MRTQHSSWIISFLATTVGICGVVYQPVRAVQELPGRIPEAAPYVTAEAQFFPPPFEEYWKSVAHPGQCQSCHQRIFTEWSGSMMANAWRDPTWRGAFLLSARQTSTDGACSAPDPPDGSTKAQHNPFVIGGECASRFPIGDSHATVAKPGSLLDGFCSRCHMPTNYVDNVPLRGVRADRPSGLEHGALDIAFNPTSDAGTGIAFATVDSQLRNTESGKQGVSCAVCHSIAGTRDTPYTTLPRASSPPNVEYVPALGTEARSELVDAAQDMFAVPDPSQPNLGYGIGAGSFRLSPHAIGFPERLGPLVSKPLADRD